MAGKAQEAPLKLCEHPDFDQLIIRTAQHFREQGFREEFIEKDYYAMDVLRAVASHGPHSVIFKGGTSLSKAWGIISRFSEDVDLFLDPSTLGRATRGAKDRALKNVRDAIAERTGLPYTTEFSAQGFRRADAFAYRRQFAMSMQPRVLVEITTASGREPKETVPLMSYVAQFLFAEKISLDAEDETPFDVQVLHFRRTFVEKLFAIHGYVHRQVSEGRLIGSYARHYYDLHQLLLRQEVVEMLASAEYQSIREDYDRICTEAYPDVYVRPDELSFQESQALFPDPRLDASLGQQYEAQCRLICFGLYPDWRDVRSQFDQVRELL